MYTTTPYLIKCPVPEQDHSLFNVDWITKDKLMLLAVGSRQNSLLVEEHVVSDTRQFEVYRSTNGFTVAVIRHITPLIAVYKEIRTLTQLKEFFGNSQQTREVLGLLGLIDKPLEMYLGIPAKSIPSFHQTYKYIPA